MKHTEVHWSGTKTFIFKHGCGANSHQLRSWSESRDRQPFTPMDSLESSINPTPLTTFVWTVGGSRKNPHKPHGQMVESNSRSKCCLSVVRQHCWPLLHHAALGLMQKNKFSVWYSLLCVSLQVDLSSYQTLWPTSGTQVVIYLACSKEPGPGF